MALGLCTEVCPYQCAVELTCHCAFDTTQGELAASRGQLDSKARETATLNSKVELLQEEVESMTRQVW